MKTTVNGIIYDTSCSRLSNQCITRKYNVTDCDEDGWVAPNKVVIIDRVNLPSKSIYKTNDFIQQRHKEILKTLSN